MGTTTPGGDSGGGRGGGLGDVNAQREQLHRLLTEAEDLLAEALDLRQRLHSRSGHHPACAEVWLLQSRASCLRGDFARASELAELALGVQRLHLGPAHPATRHTLKWAAWVAPRVPQADMKKVAAVYEVGHSGW
jgi:hypothetical protein